MEVMPAAMVLSLLVLTYLVFASGIFLIVRHNVQGTSTLDVPGTGGANCDGGDAGPTPGTASAAGCTRFASSPTGEIFLDPTGSSTTTSGVVGDGSSLSSLLPVIDEEEDGERTSREALSALAAAGRYEAVFSGYFEGMSDLYGSVSLHASVKNETVLKSLPDPAAVDLVLEACTEGPGVGQEWDFCEGDWVPVLHQVSHAFQFSDVLFIIFCLVMIAVVCKCIIAFNIVCVRCVFVRWSTLESGACGKGSRKGRGQPVGAFFCVS